MPNESSKNPFVSVVAWLDLEIELALMGLNHLLNNKVQVLKQMIYNELVLT